MSGPQGEVSRTARGRAPGQEPAPLGGLFEARIPEISWEELSSGPLPPILDVRAPAEFEEDHVPGACSVPVFSDAERSRVGTIYREAGPLAARGWGETQVRRRIDGYLDLLHQGIGESEGGRCVVACARGGMRSRAVAALLREQGLDAIQLRGGYRSYRQWIRAQLAEVRLSNPVVLHGLTGVGKTRVLREVARRWPDRVVDLEGIAGHRSSVLGDVGLRPVSQKRFESRLVRALGKLRGPWDLFEWESRRLGDREIPGALFHQLEGGVHVELRATRSQRIELLCDEYLSAAPPEQLARRLAGLRRFEAFGDAGVAELQQRLRAGDARFVVGRLLDLHYDPRYRHGGRRFTPELVLDSSSVEDAAAELSAWIEEHHP